MTEYIELKTAKEAVHRIMEPWPNLEEDIYDLLNEVSSADVVERKKGEWFDRGSLSCRCSNCGCKSTKEYSFCPNCGADMRGQKDG